LAPAAFAQDAKPQPKPEPPLQELRLPGAIADFVAGFDPATLRPLAVERTRLAFVDTLARGARRQPRRGAIVCARRKQRRKRRWSASRKMRSGPC
jgi:hypothetical protein